MAWVVTNSSDSSKYDLYIGGDSRGVYASPWSSYLFYNFPSLETIDLRNFNTSGSTTTSSMFTSCGKLTNINVQEFDTSRVTDMSFMFANCQNLTTLDLSSFNTIQVQNMSSMFSSCVSLTSLNLKNFNINNVTNFANIFLTVKDNLKITTNSNTRTKILSLTYPNRPAAWNDSNFVIV